MGAKMSINRVFFFTVSTIAIGLSACGSGGGAPSSTPSSVPSTPSMPPVPQPSIQDTTKTKAYKLYATDEIASTKNAKNPNKFFNLDSPEPLLFNFMDVINTDEIVKEVNKSNPNATDEEKRKLVFSKLLAQDTNSDKSATLYKNFKDGILSGKIQPFKNFASFKPEDTVLLLFTDFNFDFNKTVPNIDLIQIKRHTADEYDQFKFSASNKMAEIDILDAGGTIQKGMRVSLTNNAKLETSRISVQKYSSFDISEGTFLLVPGTTIQLDSQINQIKSSYLNLFEGDTQGPFFNPEINISSIDGKLIDTKKEIMIPENVYVTGGGEIQSTALQNKGVLLLGPLSLRKTSETNDIPSIIPMVVKGNFTQSSTGVLTFLLAKASETALLQVEGTATVDGNLDFVFYKSTLSSLETKSFNLVKAKSIKIGTKAQNKFNGSQKIGRVTLSLAHDETSITTKIEKIDPVIGKKSATMIQPKPLESFWHTIENLGGLESLPLHISSDETLASLNTIQNMALDQIQRMFTLQMPGESFMVSMEERKPQGWNTFSGAQNQYHYYGSVFKGNGYRFQGTLYRTPENNKDVSSWGHGLTVQNYFNIGHSSDFIVQMDYRDTKKNHMNQCALGNITGALHHNLFMAQAGFERHFSIGALNLSPSVTGGVGFLSHENTYTLAPDLHIKDNNKGEAFTYSKMAIHGAYTVAIQESLVFKPFIEMGFQSVVAPSLSTQLNWNNRAQETVMFDASSKDLYMKWGGSLETRFGQLRLFGSSYSSKNMMIEGQIAVTF